jgi:predicted MPP superfamily phosphohydrolase
MFYTDIHLTGHTPRHRIDDYPKTLNLKLHEVYAVAKAESCEFVAFGGDFFDTHRIFNYDVISEAMEAVGSSPLVTYAVIGEHDLYGHNPHTFPKSTLAFFTRHCRNMRILNEPISVNGVMLHPKHEWQSMDEVIGASVDKTKLNILICHELLSDKTAMFEVVLTSSLNSPYDLTVSGDLHHGFAAHEVNGAWYCNPGSLARKAINEIDRFP